MPARLYQRDTYLSENCTENVTPIVTDDLQFVVRVPSARWFDIQYRDGSKTVISVYVGEAFVTQMVIRDGKVHFDGMFEAYQGVVTQRYTVVKPKHDTFDLKLIIMEVATVQRFDVRLNYSAWFSVFTHGRRLLTVRPNGDWFLERLHQLVVQTVELSKRLPEAAVERIENNMICGKRTQVAATSLTASSSVNTENTREMANVSDRLKIKVKVEQDGKRAVTLQETKLGNTSESVQSEHGSDDEEENPSSSDRVSESTHVDELSGEELAQEEQEKAEMNAWIKQFANSLTLAFINTRKQRKSEKTSDDDSDN